MEIQKYNKLATIVNNLYIHYENIIKNKVANNITSEQKDALKKMLDNSELTKQFSKIKRIDQSESQKKLNQNAMILDMFKNIFIEVKPLLNKIELTSEAVKHFSDWVYKSNISQIKRIKSKNMLYLRLGTFVQDQFFLRQDYAFDAIIKRLRREYNYAKIHLKGQKDKKENEFHEAGQAVAQTAVDSKAIIELIQKISNDETMSYAERNEKVLHLVNSFLIAQDPDFENHVTRVMDEISDAKSKLNFYHYLFSVSVKVQKSITPLIKSLKFDKKNSNPSLIKAIEEFIEDKNKPSFEHDFLTDTEIQHIRADDNFSKTSKYKIILFSHIEHAIRTRELTLEYSYRYRANNSYMISDKDWNLNRENHLKVAGLTKFMDGKDVLQSMGKFLSETYERVNKRYLNGDNEALKVDKNGKWKLKAIEANFDSSKYIPSLLSNSKFKLLYELISEIDSYTKFSEEFSHSSYKHTKKSIDKKLLYATLMSLGNNLGHHDMAKATRGISSKNLNDTDQKWFSADNIKKANQVIVEFIQNLPLPTLFNDRDGVIHTSSDGKKIVVAVESLLANYSYKYYGKEQGISVNSFIDQKQTFFHVNVLTSSDREAPYMMDGIVDTKASLFREGEKQHIHSSDTHGYTEAIFAGMHFLNVSFAPRIKDVHKQTIYAYEAKSLRNNTNYPIAPNTAINKKLILKNWDDILRLMATIKIGYSSASQLFKILSSSKKDNELYRAMKEFGRLIKSKFILDYIDSKLLRRSIQKQLNRVELGQKLSGAVFFARKGKLHVGTPNEMQKTVACTTLIKNAIILWNYLFLSDYYHSLKSKDEKMFVIDSIVKGSVIAWAHINMHGLYDFDHEFKKSFSATLREMMRIKIYN